MVREASKSDITRLPLLYGSDQQALVGVGETGIIADRAFGLSGGVSSMIKHVLLGFGRYVIPLPSFVWTRGISKSAQKAIRVASMSEEYHLVRDYVVREIPRVGEPLSPEFIGNELNLSASRVSDILGELEQKLVFLFRNEQGAVVWAYPATAERTPHQVTFSTGEQGYAA